MIRQLTGRTSSYRYKMILIHLKLSKNDRLMARPDSGENEAYGKGVMLAFIASLFEKEKGKSNGFQ